MSVYACVRIWGVREERTRQSVASRLSFRAYRLWTERMAVRVRQKYYSIYFDASQLRNNGKMIDN